MDKLTTGKLNIKYEEIKINKIQGKYVSKFNEISIQYFLLIMGVILAICLEGLLEPYGVIMKISFFIIILGLLCFFLSKDSRESKPKALALEISKIVLSDIEKELKVNNRNEENNMKVYDKLVRDKIPEIIEADGKECEIEIVSKEEMTKLLEDKLMEEVNEYLEDKNLEGLADIMETLFWLAHNLGYSEEYLIKKREKIRRT